MKPRHRLANPRLQRRLGVTIIALGGVLAGTGAAIRAATDNPATYYLDTLGWFTAIAGAAFEVKSASLFFVATPRSARRRAVAFAMAGVAAGLAGCVAASTIGDDAPALLSGACMALLVSGFGFGLAGLLGLGWFFGGEYAAARIEKLSDEEW